MPEKKPMGSSDQLREEFNDSIYRPSHEEIERLAYTIWQSRGGGDGEAEQDWLQAERQLGVPEEKAQAA